MTTDLETRLAAFVRGEIERHELMETTGLSWGEILIRLGEAGLSRPVVRTRDHYNAAQKALYDEVFKPRTRKKESDG